MFNALGNDLAHSVHLNLFDCLKQQLCLCPSKEQDLHGQTYLICGFYCTMKMQWLCGCALMQTNGVSVLELTVGVTLTGGSGNAAWLSC